jgi:hypothetical protein
MERKLIAVKVNLSMFGVAMELFGAAYRQLLNLAVLGGRVKI